MNIHKNEETKKYTSQILNKIDAEEKENDKDYNKVVQNGKSNKRKSKTLKLKNNN